MKIRFNLDDLVCPFLSIVLNLTFSTRDTKHVVAPPAVPASLGVSLCKRGDIFECKTTDRCKNGENIGAWGRVYCEIRR